MKSFPLPASSLSHASPNQQRIAEVIPPGFSHSAVNRWLPEILTALGSASLLALLIFGDGFARSFGNSENGSVKVSVTLVGQTALLASLAAPEQRLLLHGLAALVILGMAGGLWIHRASAFAGTTRLGYCGMWIGYYWQAIGGRR